MSDVLFAAQRMYYHMRIHVCCEEISTVATTLVSPASLPDLLPEVRAFLNRRPTLFINGEWVPTASAQTFATVNPADAPHTARCLGPL
jgi:hypothetical protein